MDIKVFVDVFGWIGSGLIIYAYAGVSFGRLATTSALYQWLNLVGAVFLIVLTWFYAAYPATMINVVWCLIGGYSLVKIWRGNSKQ